MSTKKWEPGPLHPYPFANDDLQIKTERQPLASEKEIVPKSQLLRRAQMESQTAEELYRTCCDMILQHGFHVSQDTVTAPDPDRDLQERLHSAFEDSQIQRAVQESDLYRAYQSGQKAHPMRCAEDIIRFMQELVAVRRELYFQYDGYQVGQDGEDAVMRYLEQLAEVDGHILCDNVILHKQISGHAAQTSEIDTCVITERGIILCEIKNKYSRGAKKITISKAGRWEEFDKKTHDLHIPSQSPIEQNNTHDRDLRKFLQNHGYGSVSTIPVIVIANTNVEVVNFSQNKVIYTSELDNIFRNNRNPVCLTREQMEDIARLLHTESETVEERAFPLDTITGIADDIKQTLAKYLNDYEQEKQWVLNNTQIIFDFANSIREQQETVRQRVRQKKARRRGCLIRTAMVTILLAVLGGIGILALINSDAFQEWSQLISYKKNGETVFLNQFGDTVVLTAWPIEEYNGMACTESWNVLSNGVDSESVSYCANGPVTTVVILDDLYPHSTARWFNCSSLQSIVGLEKIHTENTVSMDSMFAGCTLLQNADEISNWDTSNVESMYDMFSNCTQLQNIDGLANWNVSNVQNMTCLFRDCTQLQNLDAISDWDVSHVTGMSAMFQGCTQLQNVDALSNWEVANVALMGGMFEDCTLLQNIDGLSRWDVSSAEHVEWMFAGCTNLQHGDLSKWDVSNVFAMNAMFYNCSELKTIGELSNWDLSGIGHGDPNSVLFEEYTAAMFSGCDKLESLPEWYE